MEIFAGRKTLFLLIIFFGLSCVPARSPLPLTESFPEAPIMIRMYAGEGRAFRYSDGTWIAEPSFNYEFAAIQRKYGDGWETIKEIHRRHPLYDGAAGARDQTLYFSVKIASVSDKRVDFVLQSSMGTGTGYSDPEFRAATVELKPHISRFAPFNAYRITQRFNYEKGRLKETIELLNKKNGLEIPFMKIEEDALIYEPVKPPALSR